MLYYEYSSQNQNSVKDKRCVGHGGFWYSNIVSLKYMRCYGTFSQIRPSTQMFYDCVWTRPCHSFEWSACHFFKFYLSRVKDWPSHPCHIDIESCCVNFERNVAISLDYTVVHYLRSPNHHPPLTLASAYAQLPFPWRMSLPLKVIKSPSVTIIIAMYQRLIIALSLYSVIILYSEL